MCALGCWNKICMYIGWFCMSLQFVQSWQRNQKPNGYPRAFCTSATLSDAILNEISRYYPAAQLNARMRSELRCWLVLLPKPAVLAGLLQLAHPSVPSASLGRHLLPHQSLERCDSSPTRLAEAASHSHQVWMLVLKVICSSAAIVF